MKEDQRILIDYYMTTVSKTYETYPSRYIFYCQRGMIDCVHVCICCFLGQVLRILVHRHSRGGGSITRTKLKMYPHTPKIVYNTVAHHTSYHSFPPYRIISQIIIYLSVLIIVCTYNSGEFMIADEYAVPSLNKAAPDANKPALKK